MLRSCPWRDVLITRESELCKESASIPGGWEVRTLFSLRALLHVVHSAFLLLIAEWYCGLFLSKLQGFREFYVASRREESSSSAVLQLCPSDKSKLQEYRSGQYVCLCLASHKYGLIHSNINLVPRRTSFLQQGLTHYEVKISHIATPSIHGTNTSQVLLDEMKEGATIELSAPIGGHVRCPGRSILGPRGMN